jgi:hypothetical protein
MTKRLLTILAAALVLLAANLESKAQIKWYDPEKAGFEVLHNQAYQGQERENFYHRFPAKAKGNVRNNIWNLACQSAGESIEFTTDSKNITVRYTVTKRHAMPHMPATGVSGVDLYTKDKNGGEVWLAGKYSFQDTLTYRFTGIEVVNKARKAQRYTLFLPLYNEVSWMEIGVDEGAKFRFEPVLPVKPIVAYGTSIGQGACASRPGMAWSNILQRRLDHPVVNLGFSGSAYLEKEVIDLIAEIDASVYFMDAMPNASSLEAEVLRDTLTKAIRQLRNARPDVPIVLADHLGYPQSKASPNHLKKENRAWDVQKAVFEQLVAEGMKNIYHIPHEDIAMPQDATVDGSHPTDYGMVVYADVYEPMLRKILNTPVYPEKTAIPVTQQRDPYNWMDRHAHILKEGAGKHFNRVLIGDSIMHFWGGADDAPSKNGPESWKEFEGTSLNMGCGYDRIENVLWRVYHGQLDGLTADRINLAIGTNNFSTSTPEQIIYGLERLIEAIRVRRPEAELVMMGILPRRNKEKDVKSLNKEIKEMAKRMGVRYEDPGKTLLQKDGKIDESLFTDGLHPNEAGYRLIQPWFK